MIEVRLEQHPFDNEFLITPEHKNQFRRDGDLLEECAFFDERDRRTMRRERDFRPEPKERV